MNFSVDEYESVGERGAYRNTVLANEAQRDAILSVTLPRNVGLDVDPLDVRYTFSKDTYTRTFPKSCDTMVTRSDDTWTRDNGRV